MRLLGYTITRAPLYNLDDVHQYQLDLRRHEDKFMKALVDGDIPEAEALKGIIHVMREVLVRMLEKM